MRSRLLYAPLIFAWSVGCAADPAVRAELSELKEQVRSLREENTRVSKRLERVEMDLAVRGPRSSAPKAASPSQPSAQIAVPTLTVVRLKPKADPAPPLATAVAVIEPDPETLEAINSAASERAQSFSDDSESSPVDPALIDQEYEQGLAALRTGNVDGGAEKLLQFAREHPKHPKADNALYFAAFGQVGLGNFDAAATILEQVLRDYPAGDAVSDAMLKLGECRTRQGRPKDAKSVYSLLIQRYPGTAAATTAEQKLAQLLRTP